MGVIRYYDGNEALKNTVITDPAVLFKAISKLIVATFKSDILPNSISADTFKNYGLFMEEDVRSIYSGEGNEQQLGLPYDYFLALLEHLNILAPAKGIGNKDFDYLLPCALTHAPESNANIFQKCGESLLLSFLDNCDELKFIPTGFFSSLLGFLCKQNWCITKRSPSEPDLYRNQASFSVCVESNKQSFTIKVQHKVFYIEFTITNVDSGKITSEHLQLQIVCNHIYTLLRNNIPDICKTLQYAETRLMFGLYCSRGGKCQDEEPHFAIHKDDTRMICSNKATDYYLKTASYWFKPGMLVNNSL